MKRRKLTDAPPKVQRRVLTAAPAQTPAPAKPAPTPFKIGEARNERVHIWLSQPVPRDVAEAWARYWQPRMKATMRLFVYEPNKPVGERASIDFFRTTIDPTAPQVDIDAPWRALEEPLRKWYWPDMSKPIPPKSVQPEPEKAAEEITAAAPAAEAPKAQPRRRTAKLPPVVTVSVVSHTDAKGKPVSVKPVTPAKGPNKSALLLEACRKSKNGMTMKELSAISGWNPGLKLLANLAASANLTLMDHGGGRYSMK